VNGAANSDIDCCKSLGASDARRLKPAIAIILYVRATSVQARREGVFDIHNTRNNTWSKSTPENQLFWKNAPMGRSKAGMQLSALSGVRVGTQNPFHDAYPHVTDRAQACSRLVRPQSCPHARAMPSITRWNGTVPLTHSFPTPHPSFLRGSLRRTSAELHAASMMQVSEPDACPASSP